MDTDTASGFLAWLMARRGWSSNRLADLCGEVSGSSVRYYVRGEATPSAAKAKCIAILFGPDDGATLLRLWEHDALAAGFAEDFPAQLAGHEHALEKLWSLNRVEYPGAPLSEVEASEVAAFIDWIRHRPAAVSEVGEADA